MESGIEYEFARNHVYGALSRSLGDLHHNIPSLLAEKRASVQPPMKNDAYFYDQVRIAQYTVAALQNFCEERLHTHDYYDARRALMKKFELPGHVPFNEEQYKLFMPAYQEDLDHESDENKRQTFRYRFVDEFKTTLNVVDCFVSCHDIGSWAHTTLFSHLHDHVDQFINPETADKGFGKYPVTKEAQFFADAARWLKERSVLAGVKGSLLISIDAEHLGGVFERAAGPAMADRLRLQQYALACETMGTAIAAIIDSGAYMAVLSNDGFTKKDRLAAGNMFASDLSVNMPQALGRFVGGFDVIHRAKIETLGETPELKFLMHQGLDDMIQDLQEKFLKTPPTPQVPSVKKTPEVPVLV